MVYERKLVFWSILLLVLALLITCRSGFTLLQPGELHSSKHFRKGYYTVDVDSIEPYLIIEGNDLTIDFHGAVIDARKDPKLPESFTGIAIHVRNSRNITIRNVNIHGFKFAILAENVEQLKLLNCDVSYNYRPRLLSQWEKEDESDWLYYHHNEKDEWKRYGAAIYLKQCYHALIKNVTCHQGFNGLLMDRSHHCLVYNNDMSFNSGLGIGMYRSSNNRILHNKLDWNARGYSHGQYARGQDSAGILLYEQSSHNTVAFNSATHSGDGFFLWAGQHTMDTGMGGCDSNLIFQNDFSHSIANGIEVTFSANWMIANKLHDSRYGIWGGYSHHSIMKDNDIQNCETGIAIEHGRYNDITDNTFINNLTGIQLWDRKQQPSDWMYPKVLNTDSRHYRITGNEFMKAGLAFKISGTDSIYLSDNTYTDVRKVFFMAEDPNTYLDTLRRIPQLQMPVVLPEKLPDGMNVDLPPSQVRGRKYIIINEWGPYNFQYPVLVLREKESVGESVHFHYEIFGPDGQWKLGFISPGAQIDRTEGVLPDSLLVTTSRSDSLSIELIYTGKDFVTQFGERIEGGKEYLFGE